jgi:hypothetical protein
MKHTNILKSFLKPVESDDDNRRVDDDDMTRRAQNEDGDLDPLVAAVEKEAQTCCHVVNLSKSMGFRPAPVDEPPAKTSASMYAISPPAKISNEPTRTEAMM